MSPNSSPRRAPRGYVLLIVLVVGLAASLAATALVSTSGHARLTAMHTDVGQLTNAIGEAGMQHAIAYLNNGVGNLNDFDEVLDPTLACAAGSERLVSIPDLGAGSSTVPLTLDGTTKNYTLREFNGGAYLIRFDDDDDDGIDVRGTWARITGNNENGGTCLEGPKGSNSTSGNHNSGEHNPLRDRNRSIWVTVVAIYPGSDPDRASHTRSFRRLHTAARFPSVPGIQIKGNVSVGTSATLAACSPIGSVEVDGDATATGPACACGFSAADNFPPQTGYGTWGNCVDTGFDCEATVTPNQMSQPFTLPGCLPGRLESPGPELQELPELATEADDYLDWSRPCIFWVDNTNGSNLNDTVWFWGADHADNSGTSCASYEGSLDTIPTPDPSAPGAASCWTPLLLGGAGTGTVPSVAGDSCYSPLWTKASGLPVTFDESGTTGGTADEDDGGGARCSWYPNGDATTGEWAGTIDPATATGLAALTSLNLALDANVGNASPIAPFPASKVLRKPDWAQRCTVQYPPPLDATVVSEDFSCDMRAAEGAGARFCNGTTHAMRYVNSGPKHFFWRPTTNAEARAVPAGVYIFTNGVSVTGGPYSFDNAAHPLNNFPDAKPMKGYLMATLASTKSIQLQQSGYHFGAGQTHEGGAGPYRRFLPSIITDESLGMKGGASQAIGGTVYARQGATWNGGGDIFLFGEMHSNGDLTIGGNGKFYWLYDVPLQSNTSVSSGLLPVSGSIPR